MTEETSLERTRRLNRERQKRYYEAHKNELKEIKKNLYHLGKNKQVEKAQDFEFTDIYPEHKDEDKPEVNQEQTEIQTLSYEKAVAMLENLPNKNKNSIKKYKNDLKQLMEASGCEDILKCIKRGKTFIKKIEKSKTKNGLMYSVNTRKGFIQTILFLIDNLNLKVSKALKKTFVTEFEKLKIQSMDETEENKTKEITISFQEYLDLIKNKLGDNSKMFVLISLYNEYTLRDNYQLKMVDNVPTNNDDNYIIFPKNGKNLKLIINHYKTSNKYGSLTLPLSKNLSKLIRAYVKSNQLKIGDYLFGKTLLSTFISEENKKLGVSIGINEMRHIKVTEELSKIPNATERLELSKRMAHSPITQLNYVRQLKE
jgi:hypothetical protein